jgi:hypothetical protein
MHAQIGTELSKARVQELLGRARRERHVRHAGRSTTRRPAPRVPDA